MANPSVANADKQRELDREIREMVSALSGRLASLHNLQQKSEHSSHLHHQFGGDDGVSFITLAGSNYGATMKGEIDEKKQSVTGPDGEEDEAFTAYVNSNFQTINNSIMLGGSYAANDPGVHLDINDLTEDESAHHKDEKKGKRKGKGTMSSKSHQEPEMF